MEACGDGTDDWWTDDSHLTELLCSMCLLLVLFYFFLFDLYLDIFRNECIVQAHILSLLHLRVRMSIDVACLHLDIHDS